MAKSAADHRCAPKVKGARFVELAGRDHPIWTGDIERLADEIEEFITGVSPASSHQTVLVTVLAARLVDPEKLARGLGDGHWREYLDQFRAAVTGTIAEFNGEPADGS